MCERTLVLSTGRVRNLPAHNVPKLTAKQSCIRQRFLLVASCTWNPRSGLHSNLRSGEPPIELFAPPFPRPASPQVWASESARVCSVGLDVGGAPLDPAGEQFTRATCQRTQTKSEPLFLGPRVRIRSASVPKSSDIDPSGLRLRGKMEEFTVSCSVWFLRDAWTRPFFTLSASMGCYCTKKGRQGCETW